MLNLNLLKRRRVEIAQLIFWPLFIYLFVLLRIEVSPITALGGIAGLALTSVGLLIRSLSAGFISKNRALAATGLYALTRNPLYFGSFLMLLGINLIIWHWLFALVTIALFALTYIPTISGEEKHLAKTFPEDWPRFKAQTPRFFPAFWRLRAYTEIEWSLSQWKRNREYNALIVFAVLVLGWLWYTA